MTTRIIRLPKRLVRFIVESPAYKDWGEGKGALATDRELFHEVHNAVAYERFRADGSLHLVAQPALVETIHQWATELTYLRGSDLADTRANVRSGRSVIKQIHPREFA